MLDTTKVLPPTVAPPTRPLSILQSIRTARRNVLELIPELAYGQPMVSGRMGARWHMVQDPGALRRVLLDNVENYPKSEVMLRMLRPAVGDSLFTSEGELMALATQSGRAGVRTAQHDGTGAGDDRNSRAGGRAAHAWQRAS